jgi:hypothetical protein
MTKQEKGKQNLYRDNGKRQNRLRFAGVGVKQMGFYGARDDLRISLRLPQELFSAFLPQETRRGGKKSNTGCNNSTNEGSLCNILWSVSFE